MSQIFTTARTTIRPPQRPHPRGSILRRIRGHSPVEGWTGHPHPGALRLVLTRASMRHGSHSCALRRTIRRTTTDASWFLRTRTSDMGPTPGAHPRRATYAVEHERHTPRQRGGWYRLRSSLPAPRLGGTGARGCPGPRSGTTGHHRRRGHPLVSGWAPRGHRMEPPRKARMCPAVSRGERHLHVGHLGARYRLPAPVGVRRRAGFAGRRKRVPRPSPRTPPAEPWVSRLAPTS